MTGIIEVEPIEGMSDEDMGHIVDLANALGSAAEGKKLAHICVATELYVLDLMNQLRDEDVKELTAAIIKQSMRVLLERIGSAKGIQAHKLN